MFMMRLRLGLTITDFSFRFSLSKATVSTILTTWLKYLFIHLGQLKIWPHRNVLVSHMPKDFKEKYPNNVCIIDCTELKIQVPSSLVKQSQSYSNYKSTNTLKSLVGVDAKGGFIFISQLYTGSISDKQIVFFLFFLFLFLFIFIYFYFFFFNFFFLILFFFFYSKYGTFFHFNYL